MNPTNQKRSNRRPARAPRGLAMVVVLSMVVLLTALVSFAITISNADRTMASKQIFNSAGNSVAESALQYARGLFWNNYNTSNHWATYLALDYSGIPATVPGGHNELTVPNLPSGYNCVVYARDDLDEPAGQNNPAYDNNLRIFIGAVCQTPQGTLAELSAPLEYDPTLQTYGSQGSGGTQGINNYTRLQGYR